MHTYQLEFHGDTRENNARYSIRLTHKSFFSEQKFKDMVDKATYEAIAILGEEAPETALGLRPYIVQHLIDKMGFDTLEYQASYGYNISDNLKENPHVQRWSKPELYLVRISAFDFVVADLRDAVPGDIVFNDLNSRQIWTTSEHSPAKYVIIASNKDFKDPNHKRINLDQIKDEVGIGHIRWDIIKAPLGEIEEAKRITMYKEGIKDAYRSNYHWLTHWWRCTMDEKGFVYLID